MTYTELERAALEAHASGITWNEFWRLFGRDVRCIEAGLPDAYTRPTERLMSIVASGGEMVEPIGATPGGTSIATR